MRAWLVGAGTCVMLAAVVAACGLSDTDEPIGAPVAEDGTTDQPEPTATPTAAPVTTDAATEAPVAAPDESPATTSSPPIAPSTSAGVETTNSSADSAISFASTVQPIITGTCARCHTGDGPGTQHVRFDTAKDVARTSFGIALVVETGYMPPWPASDESVEFRHDWSLTDDEIEAILGWHESGSPLDVADDAPMTPTDGVIGIADPDVEMVASGAYDGSEGQPDEYRCFVYDPQLTETRHVATMEFIPEQRQVVHHAVGFRVSAEDRSRIDALDGADGQGGWTCFGFSPGSSAEIVFTWAPGQAPTAFPDGSGLELEPGDFFVMQTHYHFDVEAPPDRSTFAIEWATGDDVDTIDVTVLVGPAEIPCGPDESGPLCDRNAARARAVEAYGPGGVLADLLVRACGYEVEDFAELEDGIARSSCTSRVGRPGTLVSVFGHEHELGKSFRMTLNPGRADERILLDIPVWDFDWQLIYEPAEQIELQRGDEIQIECTWDRSLRDPELEPAYVLWADGTDDEMCFAAIATR